MAKGWKNVQSSAESGSRERDSVHRPKPSYPHNARAFKRKEVLKECSFSRGTGHEPLHAYHKVTRHFVFSVYQTLHFPEENKGQFSTKEHKSQD